MCVSIGETAVLQIETMAYSDHMILEALRRVIPENPTPSYGDISKYLPIKCERTTIWRALKRLESQNFIRRIGDGRNKDYYIELVERTGV